MWGQVDSPPVEKVAATEEPVRVCSRSNEEDRRADLIGAIGYDLVHVTFTVTKGGTEFSLNLQRDLCDHSAFWTGFYHRALIRTDEPCRACRWT